MQNFKWVRVVEQYKRKECRNPLSGHSWTEQVGNPWFEVKGPFGLISRHKTEKAALKAAGEWEEFYLKHDKFLPNN